MVSKKKLMEFESLIILKIVITIFERIEVLNVQLQPESLNLQKAKIQIETTVKLLQACRDTGFDSVWTEATGKTETLDLEEPFILRVRKALRRLDDGSLPHSFATPRDRYGVMYLKDIDNAVAVYRTV